MFPEYVSALPVTARFIRAVNIVGIRVACTAEVLGRIPDPCQAGENLNEKRPREIPKPLENFLFP